MSRYIKLEDAIKAITDSCKDRCLDCEFYWNDECAINDILSDLPTIEVSEDAISREYLVKKLKSTKGFYLSAWEGFSNMNDKDKARCDELDSCIATVINAPSVIPNAKEGEWIKRSSVGNWECSLCGMDIIATEKRISDYKCCPSCMAKMKGADDESERNA